MMKNIVELRRAGREFRDLHARVISAQETERKHISRELHDGVGQILSGAKYRLQALTREMASNPDAEAKILQVGQFLDQAISEIRRISHHLMPSELVDLGLEQALRTLCRQFNEHVEVQVTLRTGQIPTAVAPEIALAFYRIAQEALTNIEKHSQATKVAIDLSLKGKELVLTMSDNGIGFKINGGMSAAGEGIGLRSMRQRVESVGGFIRIHSLPGSGMTLSVRAPLSAARGIAV